MVDGYITQTRLLEPQQLPKDPSYYNNKEWVMFNSFAPTFVTTDHRTLQTTTSFRTGVSDLSDLVTGQDQLRFLMGNYSWEHSHPGDTGHPFSFKKTTKTAQKAARMWNIGGKAYGFDGTIIPTGSTPLPAAPNFNLNWYGNRFVADCAPTVPQANLAQSVAELLREGISSVPGTAIFQSIATRGGFFRSLGGEYLNVQFGWLPFISDVLDLIKSVSKANQAILNLETNNGLVTRRQRSLPAMTTFNSSVTTNGRVNVGTNSSNIQTGWSVIYNGGTAGESGASTLHQWTRDEISFTGAFTYLLSPGQTLVEKFERYEQLAQHLLGLRITPAVLWELSPWSWLIDWFVDIGSALKAANLLTSDGLVMKYGYLQRKLTRGASRSSTVAFLGEGGSTWTKSEVEFSFTRYRATPFGFGLNPSTFSTRQWAILGALGLTKAPNSLF